MMVINRGEGGLIGGAEKHVLDLCQHLPNKGYTVIITSNHEKLEKYAKSDSTRNSALIFETLPRSGSWLVPLSRLISKYQPDIIHAHKFKASVLARFTGKLQGKKIITTLHGSPGLWHVPPPQKKRNAWINRVTGNMLTDKIIAVSDEEQRVMIQKEKIKSQKITVIRNGLFQADNFPQTKPFTKPDITITTTAHFNAAKGHVDIIAAAPSIITRFPKVRFLWLGAGGLEGQLKQSIADNGLQRSITLRSDVTPAQIPNILAASDVFLLPSRWEGMSYAVLEAMAAALPIVTTNVGGNSTLIQHGRNGLLIKPKNPASMTRAITYLIKNQDEAKAMGSAARQTVISRFSGEIMLEKLHTIYQSLL